MKNPNHTQHGNAFFYILIAVALLGALSYAVTQSSRGNIDKLDEERMGILATEMISYSNAVASGVAQLRLRGVKPEDMCFDHDNWPKDVNYTHNSCADEQNRVFHLGGAGVSWVNLPKLTQTSDSPLPDIWHYVTGNEILDIGTNCRDENCTELLMIAQDLRRGVCQALNRKLSVSAINAPIPEVENISLDSFRGHFDYFGTIGEDEENSVLAGKSSGCFEKIDQPSMYIFYRVLQAR